MKRILFILVLMCTTTLYAQEFSSSTFWKDYGDIYRLYNENKLDSALIRLKALEGSVLSATPFPAKEYAYIMYSLSDIYIRQNRFKESERVLDIADQELSSHGKDAIAQRKILLIQKGSIHILIEDIDGARECFMQAKDIFEREDDDSSVDYALCLSGLAVTYQKTKDYIVSNFLLTVSVNIFIETAKELGTNPLEDSRFLVLWNNIALNYQLMGDNESASKIREQVLNMEIPHSEADYLALVNAAGAEIQKGNYDAAIELLEKADGSTHVCNKYTDYEYQNLLLSLYLSDDGRSVDILKHYSDYIKDNLSSILLTYAESEWEAYWFQKSLILEMMTNAIAWKYKLPELNELAFNNTLYTKNLSTRFSKIVSDYAKCNPSPGIRDEYNQLLHLKKEITEKGLSNDSVRKIREKIVTLEREIISHINSPTDIFNDSEISCKTVQQHLKANEVAIEFVAFPELKSHNDGLAYYGALIERQDFTHPVFVKLCDYDFLEDVLDSRNLHNEVFIDSLYGLQNDMLYKHLFLPLEKYLHGVDIIYFSPISSLHKINLAAIATSDGLRLMDKYTFIEVSSTAKIIQEISEKRENSFSQVFLFGGVNYNEDIAEMELEALNYPRYHSLSDISTRSISRGAWEPLPGSLTEVQQIDSILQANKIASTLLGGSKANEEAFKALDGNSPGIIHLATHGFFFEEEREAPSLYFNNTNSYTDKNLPMQFSGLLLAGANNAWKGNKLPANVEDGILTAEEISQMDLSGTQIAILSACDTGLGKINDVDGVYGLQRGLKMAGVETIVMSLWKISDEATKILMVEFYKNLMEGKTKLQSLKDAQKHLREVENGKYDDPKYWASFIMLDGLN